MMGVVAHDLVQLWGSDGYNDHRIIPSTPLNRQTLSIYTHHLKVEGDGVDIQGKSIC